MDKSLLDKLRHIQKLAEQGVDGERENAARMLSQLLQKNGLKIEDLVEEIKRDAYKFSYSTLWERRLLIQLYAKIVDTNLVECQKLVGRKIIIFKLTARERNQLEIEYKLYKKVFKDELNILVQAFIQKHKLYSSSPSCGKTIIDWDVLRRLMAMESNLKDVIIPIPEDRQLKGK